MAPEQARGKAVDKRADIWAFGCVVYEMLTGARAFDGEDVSVVIASIIKSDPDWQAMPADTPLLVRLVMQRCLQKDPRQRLRDMGDVRLALDGAFVTTDVAAAAVATHPPDRIRRALPWIAGLVVGSLATAIAVWLLPDAENVPQPASATRFTIQLAADEVLPGAAGTHVAISPDGRTLIYRANRGGVFRLYRRALDQLQATPIGDENAGEAPFFSPDGQWLAFSVGGTLKKVSVLGGTSETVATLPAAPRGGAWGDDGIVIGAGGTSGNGGLLRVPITGGTPALLVTPDVGRSLWYPQVLPGGAILFTSTELRPDAGDIRVFVPRTGESRTLLQGAAGRVVGSGHLVFLRGATLWAVRFNLDTLTVIGNPVPVLEGIRVEPGGAVQFAVADNGTLAYVPGTASLSRMLVWIDRQGRTETVDTPPRRYLFPRLSPAGDRVLLDVRDQEADIWMWHFARKTLTRLTFDPALDTAPAWTPDGRQVVFISTRQNGINTPFRQAADGTGTAQRLGSDQRPLDQPSLSPDGTRLVLRAVSAETGEDIVVMRLDGDQRVEPVVNTRFAERNPELSPDGRWIAYQSNESGRHEIYIRPFPNVTEGRWQISTDGGTRPAWNRNGREILYVNLTGTLMGVPVETAAAFGFGNARRVVDLSEVPPDLTRFYDVSPDGRRFLVAQDEDAASGAQIHVVQDWAEELNRLVPVD